MLYWSESINIFQCYVLLWLQYFGTFPQHYAAFLRFYQLSSNSHPLSQTQSQWTLRSRSNRLCNRNYECNNTIKQCIVYTVVMMTLFEQFQHSPSYLNDSRNISRTICPVKSSGRESQYRLFSISKVQTGTEPRFH